jgi:hypothetical protein
MQKPIPGFPGYEITDDGRVWSNKTRRGVAGGRWLRAHKSNYGYKQVALYSNGVATLRVVHRLVLEAFVGPRPSGMECCHNNGDPSDNRLENLRWDTRSANQKDAVRHGSAGGFKNRGRGGKLTAANVLRIADLRKAGFSLRYISRVYGISIAQVSNIAHHKTWRHLWAKE